MSLIWPIDRSLGTFVECGTQARKHAATGTLHLHGSDEHRDGAQLIVKKGVEAPLADGGEHPADIQALAPECAVGSLSWDPRDVILTLHDLGRTQEGSSRPFRTIRSDDGLRPQAGADRQVSGAPELGLNARISARNPVDVFSI